MTDLITEQIELAFNPLEKRDAHGRWVKGPVSQIEQLLRPAHDSGGVLPDSQRFGGGTHAASLRQRQHDHRRAALDTWTVDEQGNIIRGAHPGVHGQAVTPGTSTENREARRAARQLKRDIAAAVHVPSGHWRFFDSAGQHRTKPQVGDMARFPLGAAGNMVGTVISVGGGHAVIDSADDGNRYLVDWRNGGRVVRKDPLSQIAPGARPGSSRPVPVSKLFRPVTPSPPGVMVAPGVKQYLLPGMPSGGDDPVSHLRQITENDLESGDVEIPHQGIQGSVEIVTLPSGEKVVHKKYVPGYEYMADADELSYRVSEAVGAGAPPVARPKDGEDGEIVMGFVPGVMAERYAEEQAGEQGTDSDDIESELEQSPEGERIGLLDYLIANTDRHDQNWMVTPDGEPVPIDMSSAFSEYSSSTTSDFWNGVTDIPQSEYDQITEALTGLEPEFRRLGRYTWYEQMMGRWNDITPIQEYANPTELGWRFDPDEARDTHGRWTRTGAGYKAPDTERLWIPKPKNTQFPYYPHPRDHPFFKAHPVSAANVVAAYDDSSPDERAQGMRWYADAHNLAAKMGNGNIEENAGVIAAFSPQTGWPINMFNADKSLDLGRALGPGEGMITAAMQRTAQKAIDGAPADVANHSPKTKAFARLIRAGGDEPDDELGQVVLDRHAMTVAMGRRLPKKEADGAPIGTNRYFQYAADTYRDAALEISKRGTPIAPHQLQAITWLRQQRINEAEDIGATKATTTRGGLGASHGRAAMTRHGWERWTAEAAKHKYALVPGTTGLQSEMAGTISAQLDLSWRDAWMHERRAPDGRWVHGDGQMQRGHVPTKDEIAAEDIRNTIEQEWFVAAPDDFTGRGGSPQVMDHLNKARAYWAVNDRDGAVDEVRTASLWYDNEANEGAGNRLRALATKMAGLHVPVPRHAETPPGPAEFGPHMDGIPTTTKARAQTEIQKVMDIQASTVPGIVAHQKTIVAPLMPDDSGDGTAQGETMPDGSIYLKADITAAIGGLKHTRDMQKSQVKEGFWTPADKQYTAADHSLAHEYGHVVGLHLGQEALHDPEYWGPIAKAIGIMPPRTYHTQDGQETIRMNDLADWADRNSYALQQGVSIYGTSSPFEMQADLWAEFTMSSHPRPAAVAFGEYALAHLPAADLPAGKAAAS